MEIQIYTLLVSIVGFIFIGLCLVLFSGKVRDLNEKVKEISQPAHPDEAVNLDSRINMKLDPLVNMVNAQSTLISSILQQLGNIAVIKAIPGKEVATTAAGNEPVKIGEKNQEEIADDKNKRELEHRLSIVDMDKKLDSLLNGTDFTMSIWQGFQEPFDVCAEKLAKYLGEHGIPLPRIEPYPDLKENNPNFWIFMIVQAQSWKNEGRRFLIPRNFARYDQLWHKHLFEIRGNVNKPDSFIKGLVRCAILMNGNLADNIDKRLVELKGIISVD